MAYTVEEALQHGFDVFEKSLGSHVSNPEIEDGWKDLFRFKAELNLDYANEHMEMLERLCEFMGEQAARFAGDGPVELKHVVAAFPEVQARANRINRGPTLLC